VCDYFFNKPPLAKLTVLCVSDDPNFLLQPAPTKTGKQHQLQQVYNRRLESGASAKRTERPFQTSKLTPLPNIQSLTKSTEFA
jgi:hypothetical protein